MFELTLFTWWQETQIALPNIFDQILSDSTKSNVLIVVGTVELFLNALKLRGVAAVLFTLVASLLYGVIQFGLGADGIFLGLIIGALAAATFFLSKNLGALTQAAGLGSFEVKPSNLSDQAAKIFRSGDALLVKLGKIIMFILFRWN